MIGINGLKTRGCYDGDSGDDFSTVVKVAVIIAAIVITVVVVLLVVV